MYKYDTRRIQPRKMLPQRISSIVWFVENCRRNPLTFAAVAVRALLRSSWPLRATQKADIVPPFFNRRVAKTAIPLRASDAVRCDAFD